jgi:hypothetical protein
MICIVDGGCVFCAVRIEGLYIISMNLMQQTIAM